MDDAQLISQLNTRLLALRARHVAKAWGVGEQWKWVQIRKKLREASALAQECLTQSSADLADEWRIACDDHAYMQPLTPLLMMWMLVFMVGRSSVV